MASDEREVLFAWGGVEMVFSAGFEVLDGG